MATTSSGTKNNARTAAEEPVFPASTAPALRIYAEGTLRQGIIRALEDEVLGSEKTRDTRPKKRS